MSEPSEYTSEFEIDVLESKEDVRTILDSLEYSFNELESVERPQVLVLGPGPLFPEAKLLQEWSERTNHDVDLTCVEKEDVDSLYIQKLLGIYDTEHYKMKFVNSKFEDFPFDSQYDLVLLLRFSNFSLIPDSVFSHVIKAMRENGTFIMSGGVTENFRGFSLKDPQLSLETKKTIPFSNTDFYKSYAGTNLALKFKKHS